MPKPKPGMSRDEFLTTCIPEVIRDGAAENNDQAVAICARIWEDERSATPNSKMNDRTQQLIKSVRRRRREGNVTRRKEISGGITTADRYVRDVLDCVGSGLCSRYFKSNGMKSVVKAATNKLAYANSDMLVEKASSVADMRELLPDGVKLPKHSMMAIRHVLTSSKEDRDNDVLETSGAILDQKSPLLWQHMHTLPIGKVLSTVEHTEDVLKVVSVMLDLNELTEDAAKLVEADVLRFSHGFRALEFEERKADDGEMPIGFRVTRFEIFEASLVSIPSNSDAEVELFSANKLKSHFFRAHAKALDEMRPKSVACACDLKGKKGELQDGHDQPTVAKDQEHPETVEHPESDQKDAEQQVVAEKQVDETKGGRQISRRNLDTLISIRDDIKALMDMDLPRAAHALCERCVKRLDGMIDSGSDDEPEDEKPAKSDPNTLLIPELASALMSKLLDERSDADEQVLNRLSKTLQAIKTLEDRSVKAEEYRRLVGSVSASN